MESQAAVKILLVEDNPINSIMAQATLSHLGYQVTTAADGLQAVEAFSPGAFDLILMDLTMPVMDGYQAAARILDLCRQQDQAPPAIVALSATMEDAEQARCREHGMTQWLTKPISPEDFQSLVQSLRPQ